jgi:enamine deaminase RidA (YjgF/YER057c/UK114 family)
VSHRRSISIDGLTHQTAIPVATRIGPLLVSSVIAPFDPGTRTVPDTVEAQIANIFRHIGLMLEAGGADWSDIAKLEFWAPSGEARKAIDVPYVERFPDEASRPARHTHAGQGESVTASFIAYIAD